MRKTISTKRAYDALRLPNRRLVKTHTIHGPAWMIYPDYLITDEVAQELLAKSDVRPNEDGLFPGQSQTWGIGDYARQA